MGTYHKEQQDAPILALIGKGGESMFFWVVFLRGTTVDVTECWRAMYDEIKVLGKGMNKERCEVLV
jgi:hypothetical protein